MIRFNEKTIVGSSAVIPFTDEGKSAADSYICHMYDLRCGRNPHHTLDIKGQEIGLGSFRNNIHTKQL